MERKVIIRNNLSACLLVLLVLVGCDTNDQKETEYDTHGEIKEKLERMVLKDKDLRNALLLVHSDKYDFHWKFAFGVTGAEQKIIENDNPYHNASIGKTFTSIIIARLYERGEISYDDPISKYLSPEMLENLFV